MDKKKSDLLEALAKIPGLDELDIPLEDLPSDGDLTRLTDELMAALDKELAILVPACEASLAEIAVKTMDDAGCEGEPVGWESSSPTGALRSGKSKPVTVRMPIWLLEAYRKKAAETGGAYQTLMIRALKNATSGW